MLVVLQSGLHAAAYYGRNHDVHQHGGGRPRHLQQFYHEPPSPPAAVPYRFEYGVKDSRARHAHGRYEESDGRGRVKGSYSVAEPDGSTRVVAYTADGARGFHAVVTNAGAARHRGGGGGGRGRALAFAATSTSTSEAAAAAAAAGYHGPEFLLHSSRPSSYYKFYWLPTTTRNHG